MLGRWDEASACFAKALELNPNEDIHAALGESYYARGKLEEAVQAFRQALDLKPDDYTTRYALGAALNDLGRHTEGLAAMAAGPGLYGCLRPARTKAWMPVIGEFRCQVANRILSDAGLCRTQVSVRE